MSENGLDAFVAPYLGELQNLRCGERVKVVAAG